MLNLMNAAEEIKQDDNHHSLFPLKLFFLLVENFKEHSENIN